MMVAPNGLDLNAVCDCAHQGRQHAFPPHARGFRWCKVPGCACKEFVAAVAEPVK